MANLNQSGDKKPAFKGRNEIFPRRRSRIAKKAETGTKLPERPS